VISGSKVRISICSIYGFAGINPENLWDKEIIDSQ
jgi:hypothetical protein